MAGAMEDFGVKGVDMKSLVVTVKEALDSAQASTRTAATKLLAVAHTFTGPQLLAALGDVKPALMKLIEDECKKMGFDPRKVRRTQKPRMVVTGGASGERERSRGRFATPAGFHRHEGTMCTRAPLLGFGISVHPFKGHSLPPNPNDCDSRRVAVKGGRAPCALCAQEQGGGCGAEVLGGRFGGGGGTAMKKWRIVILGFVWHRDREWLLNDGQIQKKPSVQS
jgi:hypothetical protein